LFWKNKRSALAFSFFFLIGWLKELIKPCNLHSIIYCAK
jgi:hypothetical protein